MDTDSFHAALRRVLRQAPDVIMIGEIRDAESAQAAITLAETGHLILATLHTSGATATINRLIDMFPPEAIPSDSLSIGHLAGRRDLAAVDSSQGKGRSGPGQ